MIVSPTLRRVMKSLVGRASDFDVYEAALEI